MKKILLIAGLCFGVLASYSQTTLSVGDMAIIGIDTPAEDFMFVTFVDLDAGTEIYFTDEEGNGTNTLSIGEGALLYTAPSFVAAGTVIVRDDSNTGFTVTSAGDLALGNSGDGLIAYQGTSLTDVTTFLHAIGEDAGDLGSFPGGFTNTLTIGADDGEYSGTRTGSATDLIAAINDNSNWTTSGSGVVPFDAGTFTVSGGTINPEPSNHVTSFTATTSSASQIDLSWNDNSGSNTASGFLVLISTGTITAPIDGTDPASDTDLTDGNGAIDVSIGLQSYSLTGLTPSTTYNFEIYPFSNNGSNIDFKIDGTVPTGSATTSASPYNPGDIVISEIMWNTPSVDEEWIEVYNATGSSINFDASWSLSSSSATWSYDFDGSLTIASGAYATIQVGTSGTFPFTPDLIRSTDNNQLGNSGSTISLKYNSNVTIDEVTYGSNDDSRTSGGGPSYEIIDLTVDNSNTSSNWQASVADGGSPGAASAVTIWTGATSPNWGDAGNWSNGLPSASLNAVIPNISSALGTGISGSITVNDINIASGVTVSISSEASLVINERATGSGQVTVNKTTTHSTTDGKYSIVGSPVTSAMTSSLGSIVYSYDESVAYNGDGNDRFTLVSTAESMAAGDAYFSANTGSISFTGTPNTGTVSQTLVYDETIDGGAANAGFNLVSNPYTAAIDVDALVAGNDPNISASIYLWQDESSNTTQGSNDDYVVYNSTSNMQTRSGVAGGNTFDGFIRSTQGFFVKATAASTLNFTAAMMSTGNNTDAGYFRKDNEANNYLRLSLNYDGLYSDMIVLLRENASLGVDRLYDAYNFSSAGMNIYSFIGNDKFAFQGLPLMTEDITVDLGFDTEVEGAYTLKLEEGLFDQYNVFLVDTKLNKTINLTSDIAYSFSAAQAKDNKRFQLVLKAAEVLNFDNIEEANFTVFTDAANLNVQTLEAYDQVNIRVLTLNGSIALEAKNVDLSGKAWTVPFNKNGLFIIAIETKNGLLVKKFLN